MKKIIIRQNSNLKNALKQMSATGEKCLVVVDKKNKLLGTLSDGDVRRAILNGNKINSSIKSIFNDNSTFLLEGSYSTEEVKNILQQMESSEPRIRVGFEKGQVVRVKDGPFVDFIGAVDEVFPDRAKLKVLVSFFGRETPVELDFLQVESA